MSVMGIKKSGMISIIGAVLVAILIGFGSLLVKYSNVGVTYEQQVKAVYDENKVTLNTYTTKVQEVAQVPSIYKDDLQDVIKGTFEGRYGADGSQAVFQMIQEQNLNLDPVMYRQIQQVMESGRNEFSTSQKKLIDVTRNYEASLNYVFSGFFLRMAGYPKINLSEYKVITLESVDTKFESGQDEVINLSKTK